MRAPQQYVGKKKLRRRVDFRCHNYLLKYHKERTEKGLSWGALVEENGLRAAQEALTAVSKRRLEYWHKKSLDPDLHNGAWGGMR